MMTGDNYNEVTKFNFGHLMCVKKQKFALCAIIIPNYYLNNNGNYIKLTEEEIIIRKNRALNSYLND